MLKPYKKVYGYAPKQALEYLKNIRISANEKRQDISKKKMTCL